MADFSAGVGAKKVIKSLLLYIRWGKKIAIGEGRKIRSSQLESKKKYRFFLIPDGTQITKCNQGAPMIRPFQRNSVGAEQIVVVRTPHWVSGRGRKKGSGGQAGWIRGYLTVEQGLVGSQIKQPHGKPYRSFGMGTHAKIPTNFGGQHECGVSEIPFWDFVLAGEPAISSHTAVGLVSSVED